MGVGLNMNSTDLSNYEDNLEGKEISVQEIKKIVEMFIKSFSKDKDYEDDFDLEVIRWEIVVNDFRDYPFIKQYFSYHFDFFDSIKCKPYLKEFEFEIINSIGTMFNGIVKKDNSRCEAKDLIKLDKIKYNNKLFSHYTKNELIFIINNLNSLQHILNIIEKKLSQNRLKVENDLSYKDSSVLPQKLINDYKNNRLNSTKYDKDTLEMLETAVVIEKQIAIIVNDKIGLIDETLKALRKVDLIITRTIFSERLKKVMELKNIDSYSIMSWLGIKQQTFSDYINKRTLPDTLKIITLARHLNVDMNYLLGLSDIMNNKEYSAYEIFKKFGVSEMAFNALNDRRKIDFPMRFRYSHLLTTLNFLLEEQDMKTLESLSDYLTYGLSDAYYTIKTSDISDFEERILTLIKKGSKFKNIEKEIAEFRSNLSMLSIHNEESTALINIQQNLINLKKNLTSSSEKKVLLGKGIQDLDEDMFNYLFNESRKENTQYIDCHNSSDIIE